MSEAGLNVAGLFLNVIGGLVIFVWGPPQPGFKQQDFYVEAGTPERQAELKRLERRHRIMSRVGLGLIILGFLLQLPIALRPVLGI